MGSLKIGGDLAATSTSGAVISARGALFPASVSKAIAIKTLTIGGAVNGAEMLAGYDRTGTAANGDAGIDKVTAGSWTASNLAAGVDRGGDGMFGTDDDIVIAGGSGVIAKIASVVVNGSIAGTGGGTDHFGFVAQEIAAFSVGGAKLPLIGGASNDLAGLPVGASGDATIREVI